MAILFDVEGDVKPTSVIIRLTEDDGTHGKLPFTLQKGTTRIYSEADQFYFKFDKPTSLESVTYYNQFDEKVTDSKRTIETLFETSTWSMPGKQIGNRLDNRFEKYKTSYRSVWNEFLAGNDVTSVYFKFKQEATSEPEPKKEEPKEEPKETYVEITVTGNKIDDITLWGNMGDEIKMNNPFRIYLDKDSYHFDESGIGLDTFNDMGGLYIDFKGMKYDKESYTFTNGKEYYFTKKGHQIFPDRILSRQGTTDSTQLSLYPTFKTFLENGEITGMNFGVTINLYSSTPPPPTKCNITYQLGNCSSSLESNSVDSGKDVSIKLTASDGYEFTSNPTIVHNNKTIEFTVSSDKKTATVNFTPAVDFIVSGTATKIGGDEPVTQVSRFIDVYLPDSSQLEKIKEIRWITASGSGDSYRGNDINTNISAMYQTFIKIPSNGVKNCKIAGYDTKISIPYTDSVLTDVRSEEVMFEEKYNSAMDYEPHTQCKIYLPFCGIFSIPSNHVIGKTIQLVYSCNLYTCDCECRIYSDHTLVQSESGKFGFEYPFRTIERTNVRVESSNYFSDLVPKIIITRHNFVTLDEHRPISYTAKASEINGYFEADNIQFDIESLAGYTWITKDDVDHIESALRGGVVNNK